MLLWLTCTTAASTASPSLAQYHSVVLLLTVTWRWGEATSSNWSPLVRTQGQLSASICSEWSSMAVTQCYYYDTALGQAGPLGWNKVILCHHLQSCFSIEQYSVRPLWRYIHIKSDTKSLLTGKYTLWMMKKKMHTDRRTALCLSRGVGDMHKQRTPYSTTLPQWPLTPTALAQHKQSHIHIGTYNHIPKHTSRRRRSRPKPAEQTVGDGRVEEVRGWISTQETVPVFLCAGRPSSSPVPMPRLAQAPKLAGQVC